ncbi:alkaline phosphatase family protein [Sphingorhabdus pulchriflava]|uniref:Alkaline phosphatase family protein n=2 Tax=Sphingorhabdus pulchriflava TaxID=2292257 RepID=A0A371BJQ2_9SPHN|nr:alkaline phosphatase family protein [Sphingorhabdus pulchriflava]
MPRLIVALAALVPAASQAEPVLLISIDGLQPADVIEAEKRGINIPNLKRFVKEGSYASGVTGVLPSVTYPSHATLVTGVSPAEHGIIGNTGFDPMQINQSGWYWYASDFKAPTLWDAAAKAGLKTANVHWPVTVGQTSIRYNLPQIWRTGHEDDVKLMKVLATPGLVDRLESSLGIAYAQGIDESIAGDENRAHFAEALILAEKPDFMTAYFTALDHEQHEKGPDTKDAHHILERIDAIVGKLVAAQLKVHPDAVIAIASDHGFATTTTEINLYRAFIDAGLMKLGADGKIKEWQAAPWNSGGSSAIMLADPDDEALVARVEALLKKLRSDPANRIAAIADRKEIARRGGNPKASFYVNFEFGAYGGGFKGKDAPLVSASGSKGTHGYFQSGGNMRSSFLIMGQGITAGKNLGEIDMRSIAPMLADKLGVALR